MKTIFVMIGVFTVCHTTGLKDGELSSQRVKINSTSLIALGEAVNITAGWSPDGGKLKVYHASKHIASCDDGKCQCYFSDDMYKTLYSYEVGDDKFNPGKCVLVLTIKALNCESSGNYTFCFDGASNCEFNDSVVIDPTCKGQRKVADQGTYWNFQRGIGIGIGIGIIPGMPLFLVLSFVVKKTGRCTGLRIDIANCVSDELMTKIKAEEDEVRRLKQKLTEHENRIAALRSEIERLKKRNESATPKTTNEEDIDDDVAPHERSNLIQR